MKTERDGGQRLRAGEHDDHRAYGDKSMLEHDRALVRFASLVLAVYNGGFWSSAVTGATELIQRKPTSFAKTKLVGFIGCFL